MKTEKISKIIPEVEDTYCRKIFLTIDTDWAHDEVLHDTIDILEQFNLEATWFITHKTEVIDRIAANKNFELGIHPNFDGLLSIMNSDCRSASEILDDLFKIVPKANCIRAHSLANSSKLQNLYKSKNLTHDANIYVPASTSLKLKPWRLWNDLIIVPHCWEDDIYCTYIDQKRCGTSLFELFNRDCLTVISFHPIHFFLNTETMERYERTRIHQKDPRTLKNHRFQGDGIRSQLSAFFKKLS